MAEDTEKSDTPPGEEKPVQPKQPATDQAAEKTSAISTSDSKKKNRPSWQDRLLPFMVVIILGVAVFFFVSTYIQMSYLHRTILQMPGVDINQSPTDSIINSAETFAERYAARELEIKSNMEAYVVAQRYHQANVYLMSGLWIRYLGFVTGMILAIVGASFVLGKLREPQQKLKGKFPGVDVSLRTASPGIILVVVGALLMFATMLDRDYYKVSDGNIYLPYAESVTTITPTPTLIDTLIPFFDEFEGTAQPP